MEDFEGVRIATANALGLDASHQSWSDIKQEVEYAEIREKYLRSDSFGKIVLLIKILMNDLFIDFEGIESFVDASFYISAALSKSQDIVSRYKGPYECCVYIGRRSHDWWVNFINQLEELYEELYEEINSDKEDQERVLEILQSLPCNREHYYYCD